MISLSQQISAYIKACVIGRSPQTRIAKTADLDRFLVWYFNRFGVNDLELWTVSTSGEYLAHLEALGLKANTINRYVATLKTFARWLHRTIGHPDPWSGLRQLVVDFPAYRGLSRRELMRLRAAVDQRAAHVVRRDQSPIRDGAIFYTLLHTGLRASELCQLDASQLQPGRFLQVRRKGSRIQSEIPIPTIAREWIDRYLAGEREATCAMWDVQTGPLFQNKHGNRLTVYDVEAICERIADQANVGLPVQDRIHLTPHRLRHTFLREVVKHHGLEVAHKLSGNVNPSIVFRYTQPSAEEASDMVEKLYHEE